MTAATPPRTSAAAGAQRRPQRELALACRGAREEQQRDVAADQDEEHHGEEIDRRKDAYLVVVRGVPAQHRVRRDMRLKMCVSGGLLAGDTLPDRRHLRLRRVEGRARREQAEHGDRRPGPRRVRVVDGAQGRPHIVRDREREPLAHHADDGHVLGPELHASADHSRVASKPRPPDVVSDHRDRWCIGALVGLHQHAPHERRAIRDAKRGRGDLGDLHGTGVSLRHDQVARHVTPGPQLRHGPQRAAPDVEVVQRAWLGTVCCDVPVANLHEPVALGQRQRWMHDQRQHLEDHGADADPERHRHAAHDGQAGILQEHPAAEFQVHGPAGEPPEHPGFALMFLHLLDAAEGSPGGEARLLRVHALRDELILEQLQVRADLARQLPFRAARAKR
jgi:hypothetical protein